MPKRTNTYGRGWNTDISPTSYPSDMYYDMVNFRPSVDDQGLVEGGRVNEKGNKFVTKINNSVELNITATSDLSGSLQFRVFYEDNSFDSYSFNHTITEDDNQTVIDMFKTLVDYIPNLYMNSNNNTIFIMHSTKGIENISIDHSSFNSQLFLSSSNFIAVLSNVKNNKIIGSIPLRNDLIFFTCSETHTTYNKCGIWKLSYNEQTGSLTSLDLLFYNQKLNFKLEYPIKGKGRYENSKVQKIYFTDGYNKLKFLNVVDENLFNYSVDRLLIAPEVTYHKPELVSVGPGGEFKSGVVQYAYNMYTKNGTQTKLSPLSNLFSITNERNKGNAINEDVNRSFTLSLNYLDTRYTSVRVYRLFYDTLGADPSINLIIDQEYSEGVDNSTIKFTFTDDGVKNLGSYSKDELLSFGGSNFVCKDLATKDNTLFPINIKSESFDLDYDARAYSFPTSTDDLPLYDNQGNLTTYTITDGSFGSTDWDQIPEKHDCINPDYWDSTNDIELKGQFINHTSRNAFTWDNNLKGGSGKNISFSFERGSISNGETMVIDNYASSDITLISHGFSKTSSTGPFIKGLERNFLNPYCMDLRGFMRGEIYRFGIEFYNKSGDRTFVKWISDIRIPESGEWLDGENQTNREQNASLTTVGDDLVAEPMYVKFNVNITSEMIENGVSGYRIMYVERKEHYRTVLSNGLVTKVQQDKEDSDDFKNYVMPEHITSSYHKDITLPQINYKIEPFTSCCFYSPEISYLKDEYQTDDLYLQIVGSYQGPIRDYIEEDSGDTFSYQYKFKTFSPANYTNSSDVVGVSQLKLLNSALTPTQAYAEKKEIGEGSRKFVNLIPHDEYLGSGATKREGGLGATGLVITLDGTMTPDNYDYYGFTTEYGPLQCSLKRTVSSQYGGASYESRSTNEYIPCSDYVIVLTNTTYPVVSNHGDTFISFHEVLRKMKYGIDGAGAPETNTPGTDRWFNAEFLTFAVETTLNTGLSYGNTHNKGSDGVHTLRERYEETNAVSAAALVVIPNNVTDIYRMNTVYNMISDFDVNFAKPINFEAIEDRDTEIKYSEVKQNNEVIDSWCEFPDNNIYELDSTFGSANAIVEYKDELFFFQDKAFGNLLVNPNAIVQSEDGTRLSMGKGNVIHDHKYVSTKLGTYNPFTVKSGQYSIMFFDHHNSRIVSFTNNYEEKSITKGVDSYVRNMINQYPIQTFNSIKNDGIAIGYDVKYKEFLFTFTSTETSNSPGFQNQDGSNSTSVDIITSDTLCFSDQRNYFLGRFSFYPPLYTDTQTLMSVSPEDGNSIYMHHKGERCTFYDQDPADSSITLLVNPEGLETFVFNNLNWTSSVEDSNYNNLYNETFSKARIWNDYQDTGTYNLTESNMRRRAREWNSTIPRNQNTSERIRDNYAKIQLSFSNMNDKRMYFGPIVTNVMLSA